MILFFLTCFTFFIYVQLREKNFGAQSLIDPCAAAKLIEATVAGFKPQNQANVWKVLGALGDAVAILYKPLMAVAYANNQAAINALFSSESAANLAALGQVFGY